MKHNNGKYIKIIEGLPHLIKHPNGGLWDGCTVTFTAHETLPNMFQFHVDTGSGGYTSRCTKDATWGAAQLIPVEGEVDIKEVL